MHTPRFAPLLAALILSACGAEAPFLKPEEQLHVQKPVDELLRSGVLNVCYSGATPWVKVEEFARQSCSRFGLQPQLTKNDRWQCAWTAPHEAQFRCIDPDMTNAGGEFLNPMDPNQVREWEKRTGRTAKSRGQRAGEQMRAAGQGPGPTELGAPPPAPITPAVPNPAPPASQQPAPKPAVPSPALPPLPPPPPAPLADPAGFNLPVGSWGDAFKDK